MASLEKPYVAALDGVRAVAIAGVFALHLDRPVVPGGSFGVDVFFVLSAYLITGNLMREHAARGSIAMGPFYWRRAFRLAPALLVWLVILAIPTAILAHQAGRVPLSAAGAIFYFNDFLQAWTHAVGTAFDQTWSLAVEEQFYIVWPTVLVLFVLRRDKQRQRQVLAALVVASLVLSLVSTNYFLPTGHLIALTLGAWAADQALRGPSGWIAPVTRQASTGFVAIAIFVVAGLTSTGGVGLRLVTICVDIAAAALILHLDARRASTLTRLAGSTIPRWIGARSYGVYLYGLTMMQFVPEVTHLRLTYAAPIDIIATGLVVAVSYRYVESPIRSRGRAWLDARRAPATRPPPGGVDIVGA